MHQLFVSIESDEKTHRLLFCLKRSFLLNSRKCLQARALGGCQVAWQLRLKRRIAAVLSFALLSTVASPKHTTVDALFYPTCFFSFILAISSSSCGLFLISTKAVLAKSKLAFCDQLKAKVIREKIGLPLMASSLLQKRRKNFTNN
jgi:hypothetical protein